MYNKQIDEVLATMLSVSINLEANSNRNRLNDSYRARESLKILDEMDTSRRDTEDSNDFFEVSPEKDSKDK